MADRVRVPVRVGDEEAVGVGVALGDARAVAVSDPDRVSNAVAEAVAVAVSTPVGTGDGVRVPALVNFPVALGVGVATAVPVAVGVPVGTAVSVGVTVKEQFQPWNSGSHAHWKTCAVHCPCPPHVPAAVQHVQYVPGPSQHCSTQPAPRHGHMAMSSSHAVPFQPRAHTQTGAPSGSHRHAPPLWHVRVHGGSGWHWDRPPTCPGQTCPASTSQSALQPSPPTPLPSSQPSYGCRMPLPHVGPAAPSAYVSVRRKPFLRNAKAMHFGGRRERTKRGTVAPSMDHLWVGGNRCPWRGILRCPCRSSAASVGAIGVVAEIRWPQLQILCFWKTGFGCPHTRSTRQTGH